MIFLKAKNKSQNIKQGFTPTPINIGVSSRGERGFTLVETLVGISILLVAVVAPLVLIAGNISAVFSIKDKITALYLAEDAIDYIKYRIDTNYNKFDVDNSTFWLDGIPCINDNRRCQVDSFNDPAVISTCIAIFSNISEGTNDCVPLQIDPNTGAYGYAAGWQNSKFYRTVRIQPQSGAFPNNGNDQRIIAQVFWQDRGVDKKLTLGENLFRWR